MRILVMGAAGFIGGEVVALAGRIHGLSNVMGADIVASRYGAATHTILDVRDKSAVRAVAEGFRPTCIINLAGVLGTSETFGDIASTYAVNVIGAVNVLEVCREFNCAYVGVETGTDWPNAYAASKRAATDIARAIQATYAVPVTILKVFNAFGPRQKGVLPVRKIVPQFVRSAVLNEDLPIYGDGRQVIDMVPVRTVGEAFVSAATLGPGHGEVIEVGTGIPTQVYEVAEAITATIGGTSALRYLGNRLGEGKGHRAADIGQLQELLRVAPPSSIWTDLDDTVAWYLDNKDWLLLDADVRSDR